MGVEFETIKDREQRAVEAGERFAVTQDLCKTKDGRVVPAGDPEAHTVFKGEGQTIPMDQAVELGLVEKEEPVREPAQNKQAAKAPNKQRKAPVKTKTKAKASK